MNYEKGRIFFGADMSTQEMDVEFKKLYDDLLSYKKTFSTLSTQSAVIVRQENDLL